MHRKTILTSAALAIAAGTAGTLIAAAPNPTPAATFAATASTLTVSESASTGLATHSARTVSVDRDRSER